MNLPYLDGSLDACRAQTLLQHQRPADDTVQARIGRQLPRLFRHAGLTDPPGTPAMVLAGQQMIRMLLGRHAGRLGEQNVLTPQQVRQWWSQLDRRQPRVHSSQAVASLSQRPPGHNCSPPASQQESQDVNAGRQRA